LAAFRRGRPDLEAEYQRDIVSTALINRAVQSLHLPGLGSAHLDLFQPFAWRFWRLIRSSGVAAIVLPRVAFSGSALSEWRKEILSEGTFASLAFLENKGEWVFQLPNGARLTIGLAVIVRDSVPVVRACGPFASEAEFIQGSNDFAEFARSSVLSWTPTAAIPLIPDSASAGVFEKMKESPSFDHVDDTWSFRPVQGDFNATADKDKFEFDTDDARGRVPVATGASFNLWEPDFGAPYAYAQVGMLRTALAEKLSRSTANRRSAYFGMRFSNLDLPIDRPRIAFRDVARATDTRSMVVSLIPPHTSATHKAPLLVRREGDTRAEAALVGIMSSIPFDWYVRRWVEVTMSFELLNPMPVPRPSLDSPIGSRLVTVAGRLAAVDGRCREWAAEVGVEVGTAKDEPVKSDLIAELDALVSLLYGLTEEQVRHIFATFHRGWNYQERLDAVLEHYANWKGAA
jgi:hypothetical protein